jgi:HAD superfamily phosphoserine phosphatase-like hydrolase
MHKNRTLVMFDFDKTIIKKDSFRIFGKLAARNIWERCLVLTLAICCKIKLITNTKYKEIILTQIWNNQNDQEQKAILDKLHNELRSLKILAVYHALKKHVEAGHDVVVISASPTFYLKPFINHWFKSIEVYASKIKIKNKRLIINNLRGPKKALRAKAIIKKRKPEHVWVYTDNISDFPIIQLADRVTLVNPSRMFSRRLSKAGIKFEIIK